MNARIGYAYSQRRVSNYNENAFPALVPYANVLPAGQTISAYQALLLSGLTGYGPVSGLNGGVFAGSGLTAAQASVFFPNNNVLPNNLYANNNRISELPGMRRYFVADRNRDKVNTLAVAGASAGAIAALFIPGTSLPTVSTDTTELRLNGRYAIDKARSVRLLYTYAHMKSADYAYDGMQPGAIAGQLPTYETAPNFTVHVVGVSYIQQF